jgi:hypothetical protein
VVKKDLSQAEIEKNLHNLNYRWKSDALALWKGEKMLSAPDQMYEQYEGFVNLETLKRIEKLTDVATKIRLKFALIDHFLRLTLLPHETELQAWSAGAAAQVDDHKVYLKDIIAWCQKSSTYPQRQILQQETGPLCKFLAPFALNYWNILLNTIHDRLGFEDYIDFCQQKKEIDYAHYYQFFKNVLRKTDSLYFPAMDRWSRLSYGLPLSALTRFDAINLLGLGQFDQLFPERSLESMTAFFQFWQIDVSRIPGLILELGQDSKKSSQAMCFILDAPKEVYVLMRPQGGWVDMETLWHELGHGLAAVHTSPKISRVERDMATSFSLSEAYAFLLQNVTLSRPFLVDYLKLAPETAKKIYYYKVLKDLSVFRRYAAKFVVEFEMFSNGNLSDGKPYADQMARYTGFYYQPESHLFDLVSEFYCLDYLLGWMGEAVLEKHLREQLGRSWMFKAKAGQILKKWWSQGNKHSIFEFFRKSRLGALTMEPLIQRWEKILQ